MKRTLNAAKPAEHKTQKREKKAPPKFLTTFQKSPMCSQSDGAKFGPVTGT
jgi:hypothetical protein